MLGKLFGNKKSEKQNPMENAFDKKAGKLFDLATTDKRWDLESEVLFTTFSFSFYGYCMGFGKLVCFMNPEQINDFVTEKLVSLGAGENYVKGLVGHAYATFDKNANQDLYYQLVGIGHSHFSTDDFTELVDSIFENAKIIEESSN